MDYLKEFNQLMDEEKEIALASCVDNIPNVRIVSFYYDQKKKGTLYFSSFKSNPKIAEFAKNSSVSFTTIPKNGNRHVRVHNGTISKSELSVFDLKDELTSKNPGFDTIVDQAGPQLDIYQITFTDAMVILNVKQRGMVTL